MAQLHAYVLKYIYIAVDIANEAVTKVLDALEAINDDYNGVRYILKLNHYLLKWTSSDADSQINVQQSYETL